LESEINEISEIKKMKKYQDNQDKVKTAFKISLTKDKLKDIDASGKKQKRPEFFKKREKNFKEIK